MATPFDKSADDDDVRMSAVYGELHALAAAQLRAQRVHHTLQPTALVHEAWLRIAGTDEAPTEKAHFVAVAATAMRHALVDHARRLSAAKRGGEDAHRVTLLSGDGPETGPPPPDVIDLDRALTRLAEGEPRLARVVELKFFGGLTIPEIAEALDVSHMTVSNDWRRARIWLARELGS